VSGSGAASAAAPNCQASQQLICHVPPGDPASEQSICVGESAVAAHLKHGDHVGACFNVIKGMIVSLASDGITIGLHSIAVDANTVITIGGMPATLGDLKLGQSVEVKVVVRPDGSLLALEIDGV
jgi:hypothetical protein